jgi:hypothetical protein
MEEGKLDKLDKQFVEELIYENIKLYDQNNRLLFENYRLREDLKELKRLERWWRGEDRQKLSGGYVH